MQQSAIKDYVSAAYRRLLSREPADLTSTATWLGVHAPAVSTLLREQGR